jgi:hypothetical protein
LHTGGERGKGDEAEFHRKFFEKLVNKNAIKPKIIFPKSLDPQRFWLKFALHPPP